MSWDTIVAALQTAGTAAEGVGSGLLKAALGSPGTSSSAQMQGPKAPMEMPQMSSSSSAPQMSSIDPQSLQPEDLMKMVEQGKPEQTPAPKFDQPAIQAPTEPSFGSKFSNTLLGQTPRTDSVSDFTGDMLQGITNPHGLVGQGVRLMGAIAAFSQGIGPGVGYLNALGAGDAAERAALGKAAAEHLTPEEYAAQTGHPVPPGTKIALTPRDMPMSTNPDEPQATPSMGERVGTIQFPSTPEELEKAVEAETKYKRSLPNFDVGKGLSDLSQSGAQAARLGLPTDAPENTAATYEAIQNIPQDGKQFKIQFDAGKGGLTAIMSQLPPEDMSMTQGQWDQVQVPKGMFKIDIPDQTDPSRHYMKIVNEKGEDMIDILRRAAENDPIAQRMLEIHAATYGGGGGEAKAGTVAATLAEVEKSIGHKIPADKKNEFRLINTSPMMPGQRDKLLTDWYDSVGFKEDPGKTKLREDTAKIQQKIQDDYNKNQKTPAPAAGGESSFSWSGSKKQYEGEGTPGRGSTPKAPTTPVTQPKQFQINPGRYGGSGSGATAPVVRGKRAAPKTFTDVQPNIDVFSGSVEDVYANHGADGAVEKIKEIVNSPDLAISLPEKEMMAFSIVEGSNLSVAEKNELHHKVQAMLAR